MRDVDATVADGLHPFRNILTGKAIEHHFRRQSKPVVLGEDVVPTPWPAWNWACRGSGGQLGLAKGWHLILAGNTGAGKSIFALNMAAAAVRAGVSVGFVSLEMSAEQLIARMLGIMTGEEVARLERGRSYNPAAAELVRERMHELVGDARLLMNDDDLPDTDPLHHLHDIVALVEHWIAAFGCQMIVVDYMQLAGAGNVDEVAERVTQVSAAFRRLAKSRKVVTIGLSQFNRTTSANWQDRPRIQGLFGASGLENDAHQVAMIDHSRYEKGQHGARTWLTIGKNRHGPEPDIPVWIDYRNLQVREALPDEESMWPGVQKAGKR